MDNDLMRNDDINVCSITRRRINIYGKAKGENSNRSNSDLIRIID